MDEIVERLMHVKFVLEFNCPGRTVSHEFCRRGAYSTEIYQPKCHSIAAARRNHVSFSQILFLCFRSSLSILLEYEQCIRFLLEFQLCQNSNIQELLHCCSQTFMFSNRTCFAVGSACWMRAHSLNLSIIAASNICKRVSGLQML